MGIERKLTRSASLQKAKLAKTKGRREALDRERRIADAGGGARRNDLLPALEIRQVPLASLKPAARKLRKLDPAHVERLVVAITDLGFTIPILVSGAEIIDGHARYAAAEAIGLPTVPAIDCSHLGYAELRKLRIAANRLGELGEWDLDALRIEMLELIDLDIDLGSIGFTAQEQDIILLDAQPIAKGDDDAPTPPVIPISKPGDLWILAEHQILCANSLEEEAYQRLLGDEQAHLVLTDPPYNVKIKDNVSGLGKKTHDEFIMASGELGDCEWQTFLDSVMQRLSASVAVGSMLLIFMDWRSIHRLTMAGLTSGLSLYNLVVWHKPGGMGAGYRSAHELIDVFCKGDRPRTNNIMLGKHGRDRTNVWSCPGANQPGSSAAEMLHLHATPKPVELCLDAILDFTDRGEIVLDAFLGSGTTLIACEASGRLCRGIELDPRFIDVSIERWQARTGSCAILADTGETFAQVTSRRSGDADARPEQENRTQKDHDDV